MSSLNFHQTFPPTLEYLSRLLEISDMADELTKEEISEITGIPTGKSSGKVDPHISYAIYMGLISNISETKNKYRLICTPLGSVIKSQDLGLREEISQLLCHVRLASHTTGAPLWSSIIRDILPNYSNGIKPIMLEDELKKRSNFGTGKIRMGAFFSTYEKSFEAFSLLLKGKENINIIQQGYKNELFYVYAYALLYEWEQVYPHNSEISSIELESLRIASVFGFSQTIFYQVLERISEKELIKINGQLSPFTVIKIAKSEDILSLIYSLLC
jgi:hypothetical protein